MYKCMYVTITQNINVLLRTFFADSHQDAETRALVTLRDQNSKLHFSFGILSTQSYSDLKVTLIPFSEYACVTLNNT